MCGVPALTGAVVRTLEPPSAVTVKWSPAPAPAPACALLCPVCPDQGENISPAQRPPDGEDGIHYTLYSLSLYFIILYNVLLRLDFNMLVEGSKLALAIYGNRQDL